jgi:hypothetical protein
MKLRRFLSVVPKPVRLLASILVCCALLIGLVVGSIAAQRAGLWTMFAYSSAALVFSVLAAVWILCLGFVFADARRRNMQSVLWVLVAALFPHLLGFLLYFVMRQPIPAICTHCGMTVPTHQRFCSWCGNSLAAPKSTNEPLTANPLSGTSQ